MAVELTFHGHASFTLRGGGATLLLDPFFTDNPLADVSADSVEADYILVSHGHGDHFGDTVAIARRTGATVISNFEIATYCENQGLKAHALHLGGGWEFPFGRVKLTIAHHGSTLPDGSPGGNPAGFLLEIEGKRVYFAGDDDALRAVGLLTPRLVIPMHYGTWPLVEQDPHAFAKRVEEMGVRCSVLPPGQKLTL